MRKCREGHQTTGDEVICQDCGAEVTGRHEVIPSAQEDVSLSENLVPELETAPVAYQNYLYEANLKNFAIGLKRFIQYEFNKNNWIAVLALFGAIFLRNASPDFSVVGIILGLVSLYVARKRSKSTTLPITAIALSPLPLWRLSQGINWPALLGVFLIVFLIVRAIKKSREDRENEPPLTSVGWGARYIDGAYRCASKTNSGLRCRGRVNPAISALCGVHR